MTQNHLTSKMNSKTKSVPKTTHFVEWRPNLYKFHAFSAYNAHLDSHLNSMAEMCLSSVWCVTQANICDAPGSSFATPNLRLWRETTKHRLFTQHYRRISSTFTSINHSNQPAVSTRPYTISRISQRLVRRSDPSWPSFLRFRTANAYLESALVSARNCGSSNLHFWTSKRGSAFLLGGFIHREATRDKNAKNKQLLINS